MRHQEQDIELLSKQAASFFGQRASRGGTSPNAAPSQSSRIISVRDLDISSPSSYQLRRQYRNTALMDEEDLDPGIPPAMFNEYNDSSYSGSNQRDLLFRFDSSISSGELAALCKADDSSTGTVPEEHTDSTYTVSDQTDVPLNRYASISSGELQSLGPQVHPEKHPFHDSPSREELSQQMFTLSVSSSISNSTRQGSHPDRHSYPLVSIMEEAKGDESTAGSDVRFPRFPL